MEEFAKILMAENHRFLKSCLEDIMKNHSEPSKRTLELIDDLKANLKKLEENQEKIDREHKEIMQRHSDAHESHMKEISDKLTEIGKYMVNVYTKEQTDEKFEKADGRYATKKTETWLDRVGWEIIKTVLLAILGLVIFTKV